MSRNNSVELATNTDDLELISASVTLYPNPASNIVYITIDNPVHRDKINSLIITDSKGAIIRKVENIQFRTEIDVSNYPTGTYIITILSNSGSIVKKVIKV